MSEQIQILEDKLVELRSNIKNTFVWIMRNRFNNQTKELIPDKEKKLAKFKKDYETTETEISNLKMEKRMDEEKMRDLELLAKTQRELEEIRKQKINEEQKKLDATKERCKNILEINIPKFKELISITKENIEILKNKHKKCLLEYKSECPNGLESDEYQSSKNIYSNAKLNLTTLHNEYNIEECPVNSCQVFESNFSKLDNMYQRKTKYLNYSQLEHKQCLKKNNERCEQLLQDIKNTNNKNKVTMRLQSNISEGFTSNENENKYSINKIQTNNQNMKNIYNEIREIEKKEYNISKSSTDIQSKYVREMNKNILFATMGSVLLYYLFFEM
mgnify:CR=1 FL=1